MLHPWHTYASALTQITQVHAYPPTPERTAPARLPCAPLPICPLHPPPHPLGPRPICPSPQVSFHVKVLLKEPGRRAAPAPPEVDAVLSRPSVKALMEPLGALLGSISE